METATATTVAKKRGRPRKVVDAEVGGEVEKGTRRASTSAVKKGKDTALTGTEKVLKSPAKSKAKTKQKAVGKKAELKNTTPTTKTAIKLPKQPTPAAPSSSKIIQQVVAKGTFRPPPPTASKPTSQMPKPNTTSTPPPSSIPNPPPSSTKPTSIPKPPPPPPPQPSTLPFKPPVSSPESTQYIHNGHLPPKYKPAGRRVTAIIVSIPVLLITSWELYQRFALGREGKKLVRFEEGEDPLRGGYGGAAGSAAPGAGATEREGVWK